MSSNVEYQICTTCHELNSAIVEFVNNEDYVIHCRSCGHIFESGHLPWESVRLIDMDVYDERDAEDDDDNEFFKALYANPRNFDTLGEWEEGFETHSPD